MELHKKKETLWSINKKDNKVSLHLKSIEEAGILTSLLVGVKNDEGELFFEMNPTEFDNFFAILKSFKNLLISRNGVDTDDGVVDFISEHKNIDNFNQTIEETTKKALDDLRQKEQDSNKQDSIDEPKEDIEMINEDLTTSEEDNQNEDIKINTEEIFNALDTIEPSVEPGKIIETPNEINTPNQVKLNNEIQNITEKKESKETNQQKLDPKEWDPW